MWWRNKVVGVVFLVFIQSIVKQSPVSNPLLQTVNATIKTDSTFLGIKKDIKRKATTPSICGYGVLLYILYSSEKSSNDCVFKATHFNTKKHKKTDGNNTEKHTFVDNTVIPRSFVLPFFFCSYESELP